MGEGVSATLPDMSRCASEGCQEFALYLDLRGDTLAAVCGEHRLNEEATQALLAEVRTRWLSLYPALKVRLP